MKVFQIIKSSEVSRGGKKKEATASKFSVLIFVEDVSAVSQRLKLGS